MNIKLVACDLDRTLIEGTSLLPEVKELLVKLPKKGIKFVINSGRHLEDILNILSQSKLNYPQGYPEAIISNHGISIHYLAGKGYTADKEWNEKREEELAILRQEIGWRGKLWEKIIEEKLGIIPEDKFIDYGVFTISFKSDQEAEKVRQVLLKENNFKYTTFIRNKHFLSVGLTTALKGKSLVRVAKHFKIKPSQVLAIGDSQNDEEMLNGNFGFIPAAPSNAEERIKTLVKANCGYVASQPNGIGVVEIVTLLLTD